MAGISDVTKFPKRWQPFAALMSGFVGSTTAYNAVIPENAPTWISWSPYIFSTIFLTLCVTAAVFDIPKSPREKSPEVS